MRLPKLFKSGLIFNTGASFIFSTFIINSYVAFCPLRSIACQINLYEPTSLFFGRPDKTPP